MSGAGYSATTPGGQVLSARGTKANPASPDFRSLLILLLLAGCGTTALKPEPKLVSSVTSIPPVQLPISVRCVKEVTGPDASRFTNGIPNIPNVAIAPTATPLQRYYQMKEALLAAEQYVLDANGVILACAAKETKP